MPPQAILKGGPGTPYEGGITPQQRLFAISYVAKPVATEAAKAAGYSHPDQAGPRLLDPARSPNVVKFIMELFEAKQRELGVEARRIVEELCAVAFFDPATMYDERGVMLHVKDMPEATRRALKRVKVSMRVVDGGKAEGGKKVTVATAEPEAHDKLAALGQLQKLLGFAEGFAPGASGGGDDDPAPSLFDWHALADGGAVELADEVEDRIEAERRLVKALPVMMAEQVAADELGDV